MVRKLKLLIAATAFGLMAASPQVYARDLKSIVSSGEIKLGYLIYPPLMNRDQKSGVVSGLIVEALNNALLPTKLKPVWVEVTWSTFAAALQSDQIDVFAGPAFATPTRALSLAFTRPYAYAGNTLVVRKADAEGRFKGRDTYEQFDRPGITVSTLLGGQSYEWAKQHFKKAKVVGVQGSDPNGHSLEVLAGRADVAYSEAASASRFVGAHSNELVDIFRAHPFNVTPYTWATKQSEPDLIAFLNTTVDYMATNGTWAELENGKYKGQLQGVFHTGRQYYVAGEGKN